MSWIEKINTNLQVRTGDGRTYYPSWLNAVKSKDYNISEFEFIDVKGTLVSRGTSKGRKFTLELFFQGDNHLDDASEFEDSAEDRRAWTVIHPFYGEFYVQPISLLIDNKDYNVSKITAVVVETITEDNPKITVDPSDAIVLAKSNYDLTIANAFVVDVPQPDPKNLNLMLANTADIYAEGEKAVTNDLDFENYFNAFNKANAAINNAIQLPFEAIRTIQDVINAPIFFINSVKNRINLLLAQSRLLSEGIGNLLRKSDKKIYETNKGTTIGAMVQAAVTNPDYANRREVIDAIEKILDEYNLFVTEIDSIQSENGGNPDSYIPDSDSLRELSSLVNFAISNLFEIAISSKQERIVYAEDDTNLLLLVHRFYGITVDDLILDQFINDNSIGINELLQIRKGRRLVYYV